MTRQEMRDAINSRPLTDFITLTRSPKAGSDMYNCPVCGSGTGTHGTGALKIYPNNRVMCAANGCFCSADGTKSSQDTLGALRIIWGCDENEVFERIGYDAVSSFQGKTKTSKTEEPDRDFTEFYEVAHGALLHSEEALNYLHGRGITDESIEKYNLGYDPNWKHSKAPEKAPSSKRIIIPRSRRTYTARRIDGGEEYKKQVEGTQKDLFNPSALEGASTAIICEGELDAISLMQCGAPVVVGIGSITNKNVIVSEMKKHPDIVYAVALDNDPKKEEGKEGRGQETQAFIIRHAQENGITVLNINPNQLYCGEKDANGALQKHPDELRRMVSSLVTLAESERAEQDRARQEEMYKRSGSSMVDSFLSRAMGRAYEPVPTGIREIDRATGGGLIRKTLITLGAAPGMGKTALAQWMLENMALKGHDVLFINLEMSRDQLIARSLSRYAFLHFKEDVSALDIMRGYKWTESQREAVLKAADKYKREVADHLIYNPEGDEGELTADLDSIISAMNKETVRLTSQGRQAPIVCIDYLQLVRGNDREDDVSAMKRALKAFKDFAIANNTIVLCIVANNRTSNKNGVSDMESGRDTSNLEYSGDMIFGLVYTVIDEEEPIPKDTGTYNIDAIRKEKREAYKLAAQKGREPEVPDVCKKITLKINKNRFGQDERRARLIFDGKHMMYQSADSFVPVSENETIPFDKTYNGIPIV